MSIEFMECAACAAKPGSPALCEACLHNRKIVSELNHRIKSLEEGACRFHCRMRKDMWCAGGKYVYEHWHNLERPMDKDIQNLYNEWRTQHD
jgi:hypothetical protein